MCGTRNFDRPCDLSHCAALTQTSWRRKQFCLAGDILTHRREYMSLPKALGTRLALLGLLYGFQLPFREFPGVEYRVGEISLPPDWQEKTEWAFARLMYPQSPYGRGGRGFGFRGGYGGFGQWAQGNTMRTQDYPRADRHFVQALRRLPRLHVRSVEQAVNLDQSRVWDWPPLYPGQTGHRQLPA